MLRGDASRIVEINSQKIHACDMKISIIIARETAFRLARGGICEILKKVLAGYVRRVSVCDVTSNPMPNAHAADKESLSFYIPRTLAIRVRKKAKKRGETLTEYLTSLLTNATIDIELTAEDHQAIAAAIRKAETTRKRGATQHPLTRGVKKKAGEAGRK
jgi:hypothetical protein